jgi:hypothetical protein
MAKPLSVVFKGETVQLELEKIERAKLYGYIDNEVVDDTGKKCELATLISDGHSIVGKGGTALAYLTPEGMWRRKAELKAVDLNSNIIVPVKSTFESPVTLDKTVSIDDYLSHNIHLIYRMSPDEEHPALIAELKKGTIFNFPFSYRGGLEASAGFLLLGSDGNIFMCVGTPTAAEYVDIKATAEVVAETDTAAGEEEDPLDFSLV